MAIFWRAKRVSSQLAPNRHITHRQVNDRFRLVSSIFSRAVYLAVHLSSFEQLSSLHGSRLLLSNSSRAAPAAKRRTSWQTSGFIVQWEALHRILGYISTPRVSIPRFSLRETSSHFAAIAVVPTRVPIGFCKRSRQLLHFEHEPSAFSGGVLTLESQRGKDPATC